MIYFDHAASSFPKPRTVVKAVTEALTEYGANPGRGGHKLAVRASSVISEARHELAELFGLEDPKHVAFYQNATHALNQGIKGIPFQAGDHVLTTSYEHNSVRRPLEALKLEKGIDVTYFQPNHNGEIDEVAFSKAIQPHTKLIVVSHGSNLTGMILNIEKIGKIAKENNCLFMVDASQTAGILPINMEKMNIDLLAFPGHKGLCGPQGTGALLFQKGIELYTLFHGGTGSHSEDIEQPQILPDRFESGTLNTPGIAGLLAGIKAVKQKSLEKIYTHEAALTNYCIQQLKQIEDVVIFGPDEEVARLAVVPFYIEGIDSHEIAMILDEHYNIAVRAGLHCTPLAHETLGTIGHGLVRVSFGITNTKAEIDQFIGALEEIRAGYLG
ncbi:aminotransferase class V-fold PLP-dependent enzyme [Bacillus taeanensis]|uniref:cysteine desulfurase n=1 Tax=Bacillus taeanensis TaxID=273032 RepID=A0A366XWJ0_9BACI|nr:aminotransferase class V-fold PLP-dependent enzyme [Bacillus taeanensis]RBW69139.1 cysteine desulfurase [Bacillus taeanensis]